MTDQQPMLLASYDAGDCSLERLKRLGFTVFQYDTDHLSTDEAAPGVWDFGRNGWGGGGKYERIYERIRAQGGKWMLMTHFAWPPEWYRRTRRYTRLACLEHRQTCEAFSIWDPEAVRYLDRGYGALRAHFGNSREVIWGFYVGVHGDYGEAMFPAYYRIQAGLKDDWLEHFEDLHNHLGFWCGDELAQRDFRNRMLERYGGLPALNAAWGTGYARGEAVAYPIFGMDSRRHYLDFVRWYLDSMVRYTAAHLESLARHFPEQLKLVPLGAESEDVRIGQDYSALVKRCGELGAQVRSTHGGFYPFDRNAVSQLAHIGSACKHYGVPFWTEPQSGISPAGQVGRIFEALCLGSSAFWDWPRNLEDPAVAAVLRQYRHLLVRDMPLVESALLFPQTDHYLHPTRGFPQRYARLGARTRSLIHSDVVDERMIADGALERYRFLIHLEGSVFEAETLERIGAWVRRGGVLALLVERDLETVEGDAGLAAGLLGLDSVPLDGVPHGVGQGFVLAQRYEPEEEEAYLARLRELLYRDPPTGMPARGLDTGNERVFGLLYPDGRAYLYNMDGAEQRVTVAGRCVAVPPAAIVGCGPLPL